MSEMTIILQRLDEVQGSINGLRGEFTRRMDKVESRLDNVESSLDKLTQRVDKVESSLDKLTQRMDKVESRLDKLTQRVDKMESSLGELTQRVGNVEYGLGQEIQAVYELAQQNAGNIQQLLLYKSRIINVSAIADRVEHLEECQKVTTGVVASHSEAIRKLESRLA